MDRTHEPPHRHATGPDPVARREFLVRTGQWAARTALGVSVGGGLVAAFGCGDGIPTGPPLPSVPGLAPTDPLSDLQLTPGIDSDSYLLELLLERAHYRATTGTGEPRVVLRYAEGRPYTLTRPIRIPEGVTLEGETVAGRRPRLEATREGQLALNRNTVCQGLHLVGPGPGAVSRKSEVVPGINSGGQVDLGTGEVLRWMEGWTLRDCRIEGFSGAGINTGIGVRNVVIEGVESVGNGNAGVQVGLLNDGIQILDGYYVRNGTNGIDVNGTRCRIEGNTASRNGWNRFWDAGAVLASDRNGILLYIAPFRGTASTLGLEAVANVVRGNETMYNERAGIMAVGTSAGTGLGAAQRDALIEGNRCVRNLAGVVVEGAGGGTVRDAVVRGNKLVHNGGESEGSLKGWGFMAIANRNPGTRLEENLFSGNWIAPWLFNEPGQVSAERNIVLDGPTLDPLIQRRPS